MSEIAALRIFLAWSNFESFDIQPSLGGGIAEMNFRLATVACIALTFISAIARADSVSWKYVGSPFSARKIAACENGRLYALYEDKTIWRNSLGGADTGWIYLAASPDAEEIVCAEDRLIVIQADRSWVRNDGTDTEVVWSKLGRQKEFKKLTGNSAGGSPGFFALKDDNSLFWSTSGADGSWARVGLPDFADRITACGSSALFALNTDKTLWINRGTGDDHYWRFVDDAPLVEEIAAVKSTLIYVLNKDRTLWAGTIVHASRVIELKQDELQQVLSDFAQMDQSRLHLDHLGGIFTPSEKLRALGMLITRFAMPTWVQNLDMESLTLTTADNHMTATVRFVETGREPRVEMKFDLIARKNALGDIDFVPANPILSADFQGSLNSQVISVLGEALNRRDNQAVFKRLLLQWAEKKTGEAWQGFSFGSLHIRNGVLSFSVER